MITIIPSVNKSLAGQWKDRQTCPSPTGYRRQIPSANFKHYRSFWEYSAPTE